MVRHAWSLRWVRWACALMLVGILGLSPAASATTVETKQGHVTSAVGPVEDSSASWVALKQKPVTTWDVDDVSQWMEFVIGYPEYARFIQKHLVDGPTLLYLSDDDWETYFPLENSLHLKKLRAHVDLLRNKCLCPEPLQPIDFWGLLRTENWRLWVYGIASLQFPRLSLAYVYFFDHSIYNRVLGSEANVLTESISEERGELLVPASASIGFVVSFVVCPDLFFVFLLTRIVTTNWIVVPVIMLHYILQQYNEYFLWYGFYHFRTDGGPFQPGMRWYEKVWALYHWFLLAPPLALVTAYFLPLVVQQMLVWAFLAYVILILGGIVLVLLGAATPPHDAGQTAPNTQGGGEDRSQKKNE